MSLIITHTFWNYIINEDVFKINECKNILTKKIFNYDTKTYEYHTYYQEIPFFDNITLRFPAGLTKFLQSKIYIESEEKIKPFKEYTSDMILKIAENIHEKNPLFEIRDYQLEATLTALNNTASLIQSSTGSGKTSIISLVCKILSNQKILILNGNNFILQQIYERLQSFGINDLSWNPSKEPDYTKQIVLLNTSSSDARLNIQDEKYLQYLKTVETIIWDEAHHIQALTSFEPIFYTDPAKLLHLIGFTASPFRNDKNPYSNIDDFRTIAILGEPAFKYEMKDTIADGNIAQPYSYFIRYNNIKKDPPAHLKNNYYLQYRLNITYNHNRNLAGQEMLKFLNKNNIKTLASFSNLKPGQAMMKILKQQGINSLFICGNSTIYEWIYNKRGTLKLEKRKGNTLDVKNALNGEYNLIFGSTVLDEGVDVDLFQAVVLFSAGKTPIAGIQRIGRAARKRKNGDNISFVIDFKDIGGNYIFENQYNERKRLMEASGVKNIEKVQDFIELIETFNR